MILQKDPYREVKVCSKCDGLGVLNPTESSYEFVTCPECEGYGTYIDDQKGRIVFGLPVYVDFKTRLLLRRIRSFFILLVLLIIIISLIIIF